MKRNRWFIWNLVVLVAIGTVIGTHFWQNSLNPLIPAQAQSPPSASPNVPSPRPAASPTPSSGAIPAIPVAPSTLPTPAAPASTAPPAQLDGTYADPNGRFQVGVLKNHKISPLSGSVLIESLDGNLAYTIVAQSQPLGNPIGLIAGYDNSESLAKIAMAVFQRGEGFQPGPARLESGGGAVMDWDGSLTIGGSSQPMKGIILVRPETQNILLLLIAATQAGEAQVPGALSALAPTLEPLP